MVFPGNSATSGVQLWYCAIIAPTRSNNAQFPYPIDTRAGRLRTSNGEKTMDKGALLFAALWIAAAPAWATVDVNTAT